MEPESLSLDQIVVDTRVRKDMGNIDELANSIHEVGLIQPIVLTRDLRLVAGERRLRALRKLSVPKLIHGRTFIWNDEHDEVRLKAIECEENLKRKQFSWQEEIVAKKRLLDLMQQIHGEARPGAPSRDGNDGFGINKLAAMLGESNAQTSKDVELARLIEAVPSLGRAETKEAARRQAQLATTVAVALQQQINNPPKTEKKWTLWEGDFVNNVNNIEPSSIDFVCCDPPYGGNTQGMGPNSKPLLAQGFADGSVETKSLLMDLARASFEVLRPNTFAAFFFGFDIYDSFLCRLREVGFDVDITPLIWVKNTVTNTTPYTRYGRSYEPILVARKGEPKLFNPAQRDVIQIQNVITRGTNEQKLYHAQKPVALIEKLILDMSPPRGTVVDFCAGSGTTGEAALRQGRRAILFEKDTIACNIIKARLGGL